MYSLYSIPVKVPSPLSIREWLSPLEKTDLQVVYIVAVRCHSLASVVLVPNRARCTDVFRLAANLQAHDPDIYLGHLAKKVWKKIVSPELYPSHKRPT